jgi:hypothetical protein
VAMAEEEIRNTLLTKAYGTKIPQRSVARPDA